ncbi:hypothetical protein [Actinomadura viridis]|uniref:Uncharacterized membrane protein YraQ (UPF0718 family) n=1 Tax=Actinomadura viridis TaxID=58110 RepID=A0A931GKG0_9ACTN|nr:hypothetical protein [Actinomadura viridis]MBG6090813.1 uncharacterized membrane protein YraQ (UPF0718 family) [Actinomadura viridis]
MMLPVLVLIVALYVATLNTPIGRRLRTRLPVVVGTVLPSFLCLPFVVGFLVAGMEREALVSFLVYADVIAVFAVLVGLTRPKK